MTELNLNEMNEVRGGEEGDYIDPITGLLYDKNGRLVNNSVRSVGALS